MFRLLALAQGFLDNSGAGTILGQGGGQDRERQSREREMR